VLSETAIIVSCYIGAMYLALNALLDPWFYLRYESGWLQIAFVVAIIQGGLYLMDLYDDLQLRSNGILLANKLCILLGTAFLIQALIGYSKTTSLQLPQWTMLYGSLFVLVAIPSWRAVFFSLIRKALPYSKVLFVGMPLSARKTVEYLLERPEFGFSVIGYLDTSQTFTGAPYLGSPSELGTALHDQKPNIVVVDQGRDDFKWLSGHELLDLRASGVKVEEAAQLYEMVFGRVSLQDLRPSQIIFSEEHSVRRLTLILQTAYSFLLGCVGLILCLPIMVVVFILVKVSSPGPAFYSQRRVGKRLFSSTNSGPCTSTRKRAQAPSGPPRTTRVLLRWAVGSGSCAWTSCRSSLT
jgi:hypothetical protein